MKITKYEHACLVVEEQGKKLIVDPGIFTKSLPVNLSEVVAVVITHVHPDHCDQNLVQNILAHNPSAVFYGTDEVAQELKTIIDVKVVSGGDGVDIAPFQIKFFGGQHAIIHSSFPINQNVGVMINNTLYYPGDSFTNPAQAVKILALPVSAPWLKIAEAMDYLVAVNPEITFPTHNAILSEHGDMLVRNIIGTLAQNNNISFRIAQTGLDIMI